MESIKAAYEERMKKTVSALHDEFNAIRTGRASPALLDKVRVDYYGQKTPLSQVATISVPEARLIVIQPWDRSLFSEIEKAILKSDLGLNPSNDGKVLRIAIPPLTEQRRKELVKTARNIAEQSRVAIRNIRRDGLEELKKLQSAGGVAEDAVKKEETELQKLTDAYIAQIGQILETKEREIMEV
ncbi:MAG: ribosome recycling factor [Spirochaetota bacterium]|jgi:ribosome recycling factor|uniref:Ribosome-recycling factor n=2 Tax=Spirochaetales TaxID=136 RepID=A0A3P3XFT4_9SPIR|nr:ribosome recycling factor [Rectinema subterraneum]SLM09983.1 ribosome recycling factor [uncultured spirochete]HBE47008.1 ribosome recycling factor [Spirochaetaceae bacterium]HCX96568.1 ribosome recycling factor [Spirochaetaceae bacterium]